VIKNNLESEDFLKSVECNLTFLKSDKEYIFSDETSERVLGHGPGWDRNYGRIRRSSQHGGP